VTKGTVLTEVRDPRKRRRPDVREKRTWGRDVVGAPTFSFKGTTVWLVIIDLVEVVLTLDKPETPVGEVKRETNPSFPASYA